MTIPRLMLVDETLETLDASSEDQLRLEQTSAPSDGGPAPSSNRLLQRDAAAMGTVLFVLDEPRTLVGMGHVGYRRTFAGRRGIWGRHSPAFHGRGPGDRRGAVDPSGFH